MPTERGAQHACVERLCRAEVAADTVSAASQDTCGATLREQTANVLKLYAIHQLNTPLLLNPSAWRHLNRSSYCDVGRFFTGYLNYGLNCREKNEEIISRNSLPHYKRASSYTNKREAA